MTLKQRRKEYVETIRRLQDDIELFRNGEIRIESKVRGSNGWQDRSEATIATYEHQVRMLEQVIEMIDEKLAGEEAG
ncbi:MAG TPA: hypothetical protein VMF90_00885 [Rhizobiaceae bacterium]|nr:hypothetical protein [Rhizobiaceae bacterium]